jgi:spore germination cell wall hydrolase CwlJ-like protein
MSITQRFFGVLVAVYALTVMAPGHAEESYQVALSDGSSFTAQDFIGMAEDKVQAVARTIANPVINQRELTCLAKNIFYEAGNQPEEGKVAVGLVTLNRAQDGRFSNTVCGVVDQKAVFEVPRTHTVTKQVKVGWFGKTETQTEKQTTWLKASVCQFSWRCMFVRPPMKDDERWVESQRVARELLADEENYESLRNKYADALYFHATAIKPSWARTKERVSKIGGHIFYKEREYAKY